MKKNVLFVLFIFAAFSCLHAQQERPQWQDGKIWVKVKADYPRYQHISFDGTVLDDPDNLPLNTLAFLEKYIADYRIVKLARPFHTAKNFEPLENLYQIDFQNVASTDVLLKVLSAEPAVEYVEKVPLYYLDVTPNDPYYNSSYAWGLYKINASTAWDYSTGSTAVSVAVVDNAIEITHSDLTANIWVNTGEIASNGIDDDGNGYVDDRNGYDVADDDNNPNPPSTSFDHGTHVAGTVGARSNNGTGVASIGYNIKVMPVKATTDASSPTSVTNGYDGIVYAANSGADVINMSWGGTSYSTTGQNVITYAHNQGCVLVAAAGNDDVSTPHYPSSYTYVISVASTTSTDAKSSFSNYGTDIDVSAPGSSIYSTLPGNTYGYMSGTSMASPLVAGLCGLMLSLNPSLTPADVENCLESSCVNIDAQNPSYIGDLGSGRINAQAAMSCVSSTLNWAPQAEFTSNVTTVSAGGTVLFTDQSIYNPTTWTWTFSGGSPASYNGQNPPAVTYANPGTYNVSLYVSNANGNDTELKTGYITVLAASSCDTITNTLETDNIYIRSFGANGYLGGHNGYQITRWAEKFSNTYPVGTAVEFMDYYFVEGMTNSSTNYITATIWDASGTGGSPGAVVTSQNVLLQEIEDNQTATGFYPTRVTFPTPVSLPSGDFYVGFTLTHVAGDSVCLASTQDLASDATRPNAVWAYNTLGSGVWESFTDYVTTELSFHVYLYATTLPVSSVMSPDLPSVCSGGSISFSSAGCVNETMVDWYFNGANIDTTSQANPSVIFSTPGTYTQYLVAYNTCGFYRVDSTVVTVNASPNMSVTATFDTVCPGNSTQLTAVGATSYAWTPSTGLNNAGISNPIATPATTTTYTVVGTTAGCSDEVSITIVVDDVPVADYSYSPQPMACDNSPVLFDATPSSYASGWQWTFTNGTPATSYSEFPSVTFPPGTHAVKLVVLNTCGDRDSVTFNIDVAAAPEPDLGNDTSICLYTNFTMDAGSGYSAYTWTGGSSVTNQLTVNESVAGTNTYTVIVTDANGCQGTDDIVVDFVICATNDERGSEVVKVWPNPASDHIYFEGIPASSTITIVSPTGQIVLESVSVNNGMLKLPILSSGLYQVVISSDEFTDVMHVMIVR